MFKVLSRKLFGKNFKKLFVSLFSSVIIYFVFSQLNYNVPVASNVFGFINVFFSGTIMLQFLASKNNGAYLKGFFAMPFNKKRFIAEYAVVMCLYVLITKILFIYMMLFAVSEINLLKIITILSEYIFVCLSAMIVYAFFKDKKYISVIIILIDTAICCLLPDSPVSIVVFLLVSAIYAGVLFFVDPYRFMVTSRSKNKIKQYKKVKGSKLLVPKYILKYILSNKSNLLNIVFIFVFSLYFVFQSTASGFADGLLLGLALITLNTPLSVVVSSSKGLHKKLNSMPNKFKSFYIPYGVIVFIVNFIFSVLLVAFSSCIGSQINVKAIMVAVVFPIQNAIGTVFFEYTYPILNWRVETDLWHNPRKYIMPLILFLEAVVIMII